MTNATSKPVVKNADSKPAETKPEVKTPPAEPTPAEVKPESTKPAETPTNGAAKPESRPAEASKPESEAKPKESAKPSDDSKPAEASADSGAKSEDSESSDSAESNETEVPLPEVDHKWLADCLRKARNEATELVVGKRYDLSMFQSDITGIAPSGENVMVYRKKLAMPKAPTNANGEILKESPVAPIDSEGKPMSEDSKEFKAYTKLKTEYDEYVTNKAEYDRISTLVDKFGAWYFDHPLKTSDNETVNSALFTLLNDGRIIAVASLLFRGLIGAGNGDSVLAFRLAHQIQAGTQDQRNALESNIRCYKLDPTEDKKTKEIKFVDLSKFDLSSVCSTLITIESVINAMVGIVAPEKSTTSDNAAKSELDDSALLALATGQAKKSVSVSQTNGQSDKTSEKNTGDKNKPTGKEWNADHLKNAATIASVAPTTSTGETVVKPGDNGAPEKIASTSEKIEPKEFTDNK